MELEEVIRDLETENSKLRSSNDYLKKEMAKKEEILESVNLRWWKCEVCLNIFKKSNTKVAAVLFYLSFYTFQIHENRVLAYESQGDEARIHEFTSSTSWSASFSFN